MTIPWYKNPRGEWYVIGQFALFALIAFGPRTLEGLPAWSPSWQTAGAVAGVILFPAGGILALAALARLGRSLTPFVSPREEADLQVTGAYRLVRHPLYSALILMGTGWSLWVHGWLTLGYTALLFILLDMKARREETFLLARYPGYDAYRRRVRRFIPFVY